MTNYSDNPGMVRVDYFKESGKWYMTDAVDMSLVYDYTSIHAAVEAAIIEHRGALPHFNIVVLEPYHKNAHPVMIRNADGSK